MANIKSQIKRNKQNERRHERNKAVRSELKTRVKNALGAAAGGEANTLEEMRTAISKLDKAATKGVIHKNQASRRKGRLMARIAKLQAQAEAQA